MKRFQNIVVYLGLTQDDSSVVDFANRVISLSCPRRVTFCHFEDCHPETDAIAVSYPWIGNPIEDDIRAELARIVQEHTDADGRNEFEIVVREGTTLMEILRHADKEDSDLIICGQNTNIPNLGERLSRKATCSVCLVPDGRWSSFGSVLVAVDFSPFSQYAAEMGAAFARGQRVDRLTLCHVKDPLPVRSKGTVSPDEIEKVSNKLAEDRMQKFVDGLPDYGVGIRTKILDTHVPAYAINDFAAAEGFDLVVIGSRGMDAPSPMLLGNNAEELLRIARIPILCVKQKGVGKQLLRALLDGKDNLLNRIR